MPQTTAYRIVTGNAADRVTEEVGNLLGAGWELHGDLKVDAGVYAQAMVQQEYSEYATDYSLFVTIDELDLIRHAIDSVGEAIENVVGAMGHMAAGLSDKAAE